MAKIPYRWILAYFDFLFYWALCNGFAAGGLYIVMGFSRFSFGLKIKDLCICCSWSYILISKICFSLLMSILTKQLKSSCLKVSCKEPLDFHFHKPMGHADAHTHTRIIKILNYCPMFVFSPHPKDVSCTHAIVLLPFFTNRYPPPPPLPAHALATCTEGETGRRKETMGLHNVACV